MDNIKVLDVSKNTQLEILDCDRCGLTSLDISNNLALTYLDYGGNKIPELDISKHTALERLECYSCDVTHLDVSKHINLTYLDFGPNFISEIDLSNNTKLKTLWCNGNQLTELDLSNNPELIELYCHSNDLLTLDLSNNPSIDILSCDTKLIEKNLTVKDSNGIYPYESDMSDCVGNNINKIERLNAFDSNGREITSNYSTADGIAEFTEIPNTVVYFYNFGYTGTSNNFPKTMKVTVTAKYENTDTPVNPTPSEPTSGDSTPTTPSQTIRHGGGGGGCNAGFGLFGGIIFLYALISKKLL